MKLNNYVSTASPVSSLSTLFDTTLKCYKISAKELSKLTKVSENHISEFRRGKGDVRTAILSKLLDGMETLAPMSKQHFYQLMSGEKQSPSSLNQTLVEIIQQSNEDELLDALSAIATRFRYLRNSADDSMLPSLLEVQYSKDT